MNSEMILLRRIRYLEQENAYLKSLLERWVTLEALIKEKEDKYGQEGTG